MNDYGRTYLSYDRLAFVSDNCHISGDARLLRLFCCSHLSTQRIFCLTLTEIGILFRKIFKALVKDEKDLQEVQLYVRSTTLAMRFPISSRYESVL